MSKYKNYDERFTFEGGSGTQAPIIMYGKLVEDYPIPEGGTDTVYLFFKDKNFTTVFDEEEAINSYLNGTKFLVVYDYSSQFSDTEEEFRTVYTMIYGFRYPIIDGSISRLYLNVDALGAAIVAREEDLELVADTSTETEGGDSQTETGEGGIIVGPGPKG